MSPVHEIVPLRSRAVAFHEDADMRWECVSPCNLRTKDALPLPIAARNPTLYFKSGPRNAMAADRSAGELAGAHRTSA
eukprot:13608166-Alexandrium_andersonii.AAC.1